MSSKPVFKPEEQDVLDPKYLIVPAYDCIGVEGLDGIVLLGLIFFCAQETGAFDRPIQVLADACLPKYEDVRAALLRLEKRGFVTAEKQNGKTSIYRIAHERFGYIDDKTGEPVWIAPAKKTAA